MEITGLGGGVMLAIAAVLWLVYLLPNWLKRREYLATERNAVRLQQTIRVLAQTAQAPEVVRVARSGSFPVAVGRPATPPLPVDPRVVVARRIRRARSLSTLVLAAALLAGLFQGSLMITTGAVAGSWLVLGIAALATVSAMAMLGRLAERARTSAAPVALPARRTSLGAPPVVAEKVDRSWTPVRMPKPLYLDKPHAPAFVPQVDLERAAKLAEDARRAAEREATSIPEPVAIPAGASRFARMGIIDQPTAPVDLDAALARRRAAG